MGKEFSSPCIFDFQDFRLYLREVRRSAGSSKLTYSLRNWSRRLGYRSPRSIAMVLSGIRLPSPQMILALKNDLKWSADEKTYFELLVQRERQRHPEQTQRLQLEIARLSRPPVTENVVYAPHLQQIATPLHFILRQRLKVPTSPRELAALGLELKGQFDIDQIRKSIDDLLATGLAKVEEGRIVSSQTECYRTQEDIPSAAVQFLHQNFLQMAQAAVTQQGVLDREFIQLTFVMNENRTSEAKAHIRKFVEAFNRKFGCDVDRQVFQLGVHLYRHTK